jgi:hypothetical protein
VHPRFLFALAVAVSAVFAGCLGGLTGGDAVEPREYPERPPTLDAETVGPYAAAHEEVYRHNAIVGEETEELREIVVGAGVQSVEERGDGYEVVVSVGFYSRVCNCRLIRPHDCVRSSE